MSSVIALSFQAYMVQSCKLWPLQEASRNARKSSDTVLAHPMQTLNIVLRLMRYKSTSILRPRLVNMSAIARAQDIAYSIGTLGGLEFW